MVISSKLTNHLFMREIRISDKPKVDGPFEVHSIEATSASESSKRVPTEQVKVRFDKFVQLVATHNFDEILEQNANEEIILSSNLLMDLANAHEDAPRENKKMPTIFAIALILGFVLAYVVFKLL